MKDQSLLLFGLHEVNGVGWKTIDKIMKSVSHLEGMSSFTDEQLKQMGISGQLAEAILKELNIEELHRKRNQYLRQGIQIVTVWDDDYPELLKQTAGPPWVLYCKGDLSLLRKHAVSMVGTRTPTVYGKKIAQQLAADLSSFDICVVSGMARGIDGEAHRGALLHKGSTIAVLGTGLDQVYPPEHKALFEEISKRGLLISEYPNGTPAHPGCFPVRNRIIAGLGLGTVVVEAALKSGSLITAIQALDESRDVFAVPGQITSPKSMGTLSLIKKGNAKLITTVHDILEEYKHLLYIESKSYINEEKGAAILNDDERYIMGFLSDQPKTIDEIVEKSKFPFGHLHSVLLSLLIKKQIEQLPGSTYIILKSFLS
jgi:DNA processing protein